MSEVNNYDKYAAQRQEELKSSGGKRPHKYVEKPMMKKLLPELKGKKVLMLGCGTGEESTLLREAGATDLVGIDYSAESIRLAKMNYKDCEFKVGDMHNLEFENDTFDVVYSSLVIHYSSEPLKVYKEIYRVLKSGGQLVFSIGHPMRWASAEVDINGITTKILGFTNDDDNTQIYGNYLTFAEHEHHFPSGETLSFWVGAPSFHFSLLRECGFSIENFIESKAIEECKEVSLGYYKRFSEFPQFMAFLAKKS